MYDGSPKRINFNLVEAYGPTELNGANTSIDTASGSYQVKESVSDIDNMLADTPEPTKEWR